MLVVTGHGIIDGQPSPGSTSGLENWVVLVPLVGCVESPEHNALSNPSVRVGRTRPKLLVHGHLANEVTASEVTASPGSSIAVILRALTLAASTVEIVLLAIITLSTLLLLALVLNIRILNSHAQDASPLNGREGNMDVLARAGVAVTVGLRIAAASAVNASLVGVNGRLLVIAVKLRRSSEAGYTLPAVVLEVGVCDCHLNKASELRPRREASVLMQLKSCAHLKEQTLLIPSGEIESLVDLGRILLPSSGNRLDTGGSGSI